MKVLILKSCATTVNGRATSLPKGSEPDLPDDLARALVAGGLAQSPGEHRKTRRGRKAASEPAAPPVPVPSPEVDPEPEAEAEGAEAEPEAEEAEPEAESDEDTSDEADE